MVVGKWYWYFDKTANEWKPMKWRAEFDKENEYGFWGEEIETPPRPILEIEATLKELGLEMWVTKDEDGEVWLHVEKPERYSDSWASDDCYELVGCDALKNVPWDQSLRKII